MPYSTLINSRPNSRLVFIQEMLKHPLQIGSVIPSSRFLERRIVATAEVATANVVVELGPGTGGTTRAILRAMQPHTSLLAIEINPHFHTLVSNINDKRLITHLGSACDLKEIISLYNLAPPDAIISGIPFSTMNRSEGTRILRAIVDCLMPHGHFVAYQLSKRVATLCQPFMGPERTAMELLNIPPMRVFRWDKDVT